MKKTFNHNLTNFYYAKFSESKRQFTPKIETREYLQLVDLINQNLNKYFAKGLIQHITEKSDFWANHIICNKYRLRDIDPNDIENLSVEAFDSIISYYQGLKEFYSEYNSLKIEEIIHYRSCGDDDVDSFLVGWKDEDNDLFELRMHIIKLIHQLFEHDTYLYDQINYEQKQKETKRMELEKKAKEEKEYQLFLKLQQKYKTKGAKQC